MKEKAELAVLKHGGGEVAATLKLATCMLQAKEKEKGKDKDLDGTPIRFN